MLFNRPSFNRRMFLQTIAALTSPLPAIFAMKPLLRRDYRADAVILLFSLPIYTREGVGGGFAAARLQNDAGQSVESLQFAAGSDPDRARGLNRLGFIQETVTTDAGGPAESIYTGFMTASEEESFAQAKSALEKNGDKLQYQGIEGAIHAGAARSRSVRFETPASWNWTRFAELYPFAEQMIRQAAPKGKEVVLYARSATRSFISSVQKNVRTERWRRGSPIAVSRSFPNALLPSMASYKTYAVPEVASSVSGSREARIIPSPCGSSSSRRPSSRSPSKPNTSKASPGSGVRSTLL